MTPVSASESALSHRSVWTSIVAEATNALPTRRDRTKSCTAKPELKSDENSGLTFTYAYEECKEDESAGEVNHQHGQCSLELKEKELEQYVQQFNIEVMKLRDQNDKELQQQVQQHVLTMTRQRFEKQPYFQVTLGGMKVHASMDTCCGAIGALCCEHFDKLKQNPDMAQGRGPSVVAQRHGVMEVQR